MPKVSFRMASASRESVFGVQTNTARQIHRSDHTEGRLTTAPSGCCVRKGTPCGHFACIRPPFPVEPVPRVPQHPPDEMPDEGAATGTSHDVLGGLSTLFNQLTGSGVPAVAQRATAKSRDRSAEEARPAFRAP